MKVTINEDKWGPLEESFTFDTEDPNSSSLGTVYETLEDAMFHKGHGYGCDLIVLTPEQIDKIKNGGVLAWDDGEYVHYVTVKDSPKENDKLTLSSTVAPNLAHTEVKVVSWKRADDGWGAWAELEIQNVDNVKNGPNWTGQILKKTIKTFVPPPLVSYLDMPSFVTLITYKGAPGGGFYCLVPPNTEDTTLKEKIRKVLDQRAESRKEYAKVQPRYDDVFYEGVEALDKMAKEENTED